MRIDLEEVRRRKRLVCEEVFQFDQIADGYAELARLSPVHFTGKVEYLAGLYLLEGQLQGTMILLCSRCLNEINHPFTISVRRLFTTGLGSETVEFELDEDEVESLTGDSLELTPYLEEEVKLAVPYKPLCKESCEGICPQCGQDWNEGTCDCESEQIDPRWEKLQSLLSQKEDQNE